MVVHLHYALVRLRTFAVVGLWLAAQEEEVEAIAGGRNLGVGVRRADDPGVFLRYLSVDEHVVEVESRHLAVSCEHEADAVETVLPAPRDGRVEAAPCSGVRALGVAARVSALRYLGGLAVAFHELPADPLVAALELFRDVVDIEAKQRSTPQDRGTR